MSDACLKDTEITCKKAHFCAWCGEPIVRGENARYRSGVHNGDFYSTYLHLECYEAMNKSDFDEFYFGDQQRGTIMGEEK